MGAEAWDGKMQEETKKQKHEKSQQAHTLTTLAEGSLAFQ
jgi:hypothetical protein